MQKNEKSYNNFLPPMFLIIVVTFFMFSGDMELKKDKSLPPEKQILTANPDISTVCSIHLTFYVIMPTFTIHIIYSYMDYLEECNISHYENMIFACVVYEMLHPITPVPQLAFYFYFLFFFALFDK